MSLKLFVKGLLYPGVNLGVRSRRSIARHFLREPNIRTLDVGSGNGFFAALAARRGGAGNSVLSFSFNPDQIKNCQEFQPHMGVPAGKLEFRVMTALEVDQLTEQFDQILLLEVIEHLDDDLAVVTKLARHLKPGGIMHVSTPDCWLGYWVGTLDRKAEGGHVRVGYTAERLERLLTAAGLDIAYQTRLGGLGMYLTPLQHLLARLFGGGLAVAFALIYPWYLLLEWMPLTPSWRMFHYAIARKRVCDV